MADELIENVLVPRTLLGNPQDFAGEETKDGIVGDLLLVDGRVAGLRPAGPSDEPRLVVLPKLTDCHVHLDKCHTVSRLAHVGGDLRQAIDAQAADRAGWTQEDVRHRAALGIEELIAAGCGTVRSHVDWTHGDEARRPPLAWRVLHELAQDYRDQLYLQLAPLTGIEDLAEAETADFIAANFAKATGVLGAFVFDQPRRQEGIQQAFRMADKYGLSLDFHVDEGLAPDLDGLEMIADAAIGMGFEGPILCGHACSLMNVEAEALSRIIDKLLQAKVTICCLPSTNLYLQGRGARGDTPDRRGLTRLRELQQAGVPVVVGTDNVQDAFCPIGRHDPRHALALAVLAGHLDPPLDAHLPMITTDAQRAMGLPASTIDGASIGELLLFEDPSLSDVLARPQIPWRLADIEQGESA